MENDKSQPMELEAVFKQIEELITELGSDEVSLEKSFALYHQGMEAIKKCNETIDGIEKQVQVIDQNGEYHEL